MRTTNRATALAAALTVSAILGAGCRPSPVQPDENVFISGSVQQASGAPAAGVKVGLYNDDAFEVAFSFGLAGISALHDARSDAAGSYTIRVGGRHANNLFGFARRFRLKVDGPVTDEPAVSMSFELMRTQIAAPPLRFWEGNGFIGVGALDVRFGWDDLQRTIGAPASAYGVTVDGPAGWRFVVDAGTSTSTRLPRLLLQDLAWSWWPLARASERGSGTRFNRLFLGRAQRFAPLNPTPPTRGRPVATAPASALASTVVDGRGDTGVPAGTLLRRIEIDLGAARSLEVVYLVGFKFAGISAGTSAPLVVFLAPSPGAAGTVAGRASPAQTGAGIQFAEVPLNPSVTGRYLVIEAPGAEIDGLGEVVAY